LSKRRWYQVRRGLSHTDNFRPIPRHGGNAYICTMYEKKIARDVAECGMGITMEIMGGKWKPCLIQSLHQGLKRPSELHRAHPTASARVLNQQLTELEEYGIVEKTVYPVLPPKVEYTLTDFGKSLLHITQAMEVWGQQYKETFQEKHSQRLRRMDAEAVGTPGVARYSLVVIMPNTVPGFLRAGC